MRCGRRPDIGLLSENWWTWFETEMNYVQVKIEVLRAQAFVGALMVAYLTTRAAASPDRKAWRDPENT